MSLSDEEVQKIVLKRLDALMPSLQVLVGVADHIDRQARKLILTIGDGLSYDVLILATGAAAPRSALASSGRYGRCNRLSVLYFPFSETTPTSLQFIHLAFLALLLKRF